MEEEYNDLMSKIILLTEQVQYFQCELDKKYADHNSLYISTVNLLNQGHKKPKSQQNLPPGLVIQTEQFRAKLELVFQQMIQVDRLHEEIEKLHHYQNFAEDQTKAYQFQLEDLNTINPN
ncbi:unnamed protein product [Orchesella dallaii]|uniref:Uncharacterized protein n=1 Tax=Orchesella dallaii TaxID=48710 RepID=A0ABP1Q3U6_9HEXA